MSEFPLYPNAVDTIEELARLRAENEQLREQVRARPDQEAIDMALSRAVLAERELASVRAENERLTKDLEHANNVVHQYVGLWDEAERQLTALRRPVEQSAEVETIRARYVDDFRALAFDGSIVKELNCWQDVANIQTLLSALDTTARQLRERVEMLSVVQDSLSERNRECVELRERCGQHVRDKVEMSMRIERLETALQFYARIENHQGNAATGHVPIVDDDNLGDRARAALAASQQHTAGSGDGEAGANP